MPFASFAGVSAVMAPLSTITDPRRNLVQRILSGLVLGPLALILAYYGGPVLDLALATAAVVGLDEWLRLTAGRRRSWIALTPLAILIPYWLGGAGVAIGVLVIATIVAWLVMRAEDGSALAAIGVPYLGLAVLALSFLRDVPGGGWALILFVLVIVWATDIGAFFTGRAFGGPRLAPRISPNKTWSGATGGAALACIVAALWSGYFAHGRTIGLAVALAILVSVAGQTGDLFESAIKRRFGVKDSGELIPGHGGMLDRIDALLTAAPLFAFFHAAGITADLLP